MIAIAPCVPASFISVGDQFQDGGLEGFLETLNLSGESAPPQDLTTNFGRDETPSRARWPTRCTAPMRLLAPDVSASFSSCDGMFQVHHTHHARPPPPTFPSGGP
ncbi:hypothetical protein BJY52DRAFT_957782 [Lactarius psammicola]|nr:hypothetical protein BJY52DRAFT_957782 [Lactarius psammicola]